MHKVSISIEVDGKVVHISTVERPGRPITVTEFWNFLKAVRLRISECSYDDIQTGRIIGRDWY